MPRILLVEDDDNKRTQVELFLKDTFPTVELTIARSLRSGLVALEDKSIALIILDMTLPNFDQGLDEDGGVIHPLGGQEFLRRMKRQRIDIPVIVLTQFESFGIGSESLDLASLGGTLRSKYGSLCRELIYYNNMVDTWKEKLEAAISNLLEGAQ